MVKKTGFSLGDHFSHFVSELVADGRYADASDVVRAGLRLLEEQELKIATLRAGLIEGEQAADATGFDFDTFIASRRATQSPAV